MSCPRRSVPQQRDDIAIADGHVDAAHGFDGAVATMMLANLRASSRHHFVRRDTRYAFLHSLILPDRSGVSFGDKAAEPSTMTGRPAS